MELEIIYEDTHIIVAKKPPKVPSQKDKTGDKDMLTLLKEYLINQYNVRNPYIGLIHRLDRPVGGLMVFAKTKYAITKLSEEIRSKRFEKHYYAVVCGKPNQDKGELRDFLKKNGRNNISKVVAKDVKDAKEAILEYELIKTIETEEYGALSLMKINLKTGRHHQIRVQLSNAAMPIWGDNKYNETFMKMKKWTQIALWAGFISFKHPKENKVYKYELKPSNEYPFNMFNKI